MIVGRVVGWVLVVVAAAVLILGVIVVVSGQSPGAVAGAVWFELHSDSLNLAQAVTQRYILPQLWDPVAIAVLNWPLWLAVAAVTVVLGAPGLVLVRLFRR